jgi:putative MATE family efflux protein
VNRTDRRIIALAIPALGSLAVEPLYVLVDTAIVGRLGTAQLGGLALAGTELGFVVAGCNFLTYGTTERVARRLGAGRAADAADVGVQATWLAVLVGVVVAPLVALSAPWIAAALGGSGEVHDHAVSYLRIAALGIPFVVFALAAQGVQRGAADYRTPLVILLLANAVNTVLEVVFVFGFDWGIPGSAWSTVIGQVAAGVAFAVVVRRHLHAARHRRPEPAAMAPLLSAGKHLLLRVGSMMVVITGATAVAARTDEPTLAAHQIGASLLTFLALALDALAIPAQTLVADELGRHSFAGAAQLSRRSAWLSVVTAAILAALLALLAPVIPQAFTADAAVIDRATSIVRWLAIMLVPAALAFAYDGVLIGAADYRFLGRAALAYLAAMVPVGAVVLAAQWGIAGIWGGLTLWMMLRAAVNHARQQRVLSGDVAGTALTVTVPDRFSS